MKIHIECQHCDWEIMVSSVADAITLDTEHQRTHREDSE